MTTLLPLVASVHFKPLITSARLYTCPEWPILAILANLVKPLKVKGIRFEMQDTSAEDTPIWQRPVCQTRPALQSKARCQALSRCGRCHVCGAQCDGLHSFHGGPLICDTCCPLCNQ